MDPSSRTRVSSTLRGIRRDRGSSQDTVNNYRDNSLVGTLSLTVSGGSPLSSPKASISCKFYVLASQETISCESTGHAYIF